MKLLLGIVLAVLASGCARTPTGATGAGTRLVFTMKVEGHIHGSIAGESPFVYIVAMHFSKDSNPTTTGPIPVVSPPWGNGFVAGNCNYFLRWDPASSPSGYLLYRFDPNDLTLTNYSVVGTPIVTQVVPSGGTTIQFSIDLSQLGYSASDLAALKSVQLNYLTMDRVPQGGDTGQKVWDALGDPRTASGVNTWITVPLNVAKGYGPRFGSFTGLVSPGVVPSPDLDIVDFSVEVQIQ